MGYTTSHALSSDPILVIPNFLSHSPSFPQPLTMLTHLTANRLAFLEGQILTWKGQISASFYLCETRDLQLLSDWHKALPSNFTSSLHIHLIVPQHEQGTKNLIPLNLLRNVAHDTVSASLHDSQEIHYGFLLDVDARVGIDSTTLLQDVQKAESTLGDKSEKWLWVVPALEYSMESLYFNFSLPKTKPQVRSMVQNEILLTMYATRFRFAYVPFKLYKWMDAQSPYEIEYVRQFEPYYVARLPFDAQFDETFVGRGYNKVQQILEMSMMGYRFGVLPFSWVVDIPHEVTKEGKVREATWDACTDSIWVHFLGKMIAKYGKGREKCAEYVKEKRKQGRLVTGDYGVYDMGECWMEVHREIEHISSKCVQFFH